MPPDTANPGGKNRGAGRGGGGGSKTTGAGRGHRDTTGGGTGTGTAMAAGGTGDGGIDAGGFRDDVMVGVDGNARSYGRLARHLGITKDELVQRFANGLGNW